MLNNMTGDWLVYKILCIVIGYAIGCIQTAYIVGRAKGIDIRKHGSGNAGATNAIRVMGTKTGLIVFACDVLKAVLGYVVCYILFDGDSLFSSLAGLYGGLGVILGHNFPFYLGFKGGKGIAACMGVVIVFNPLMAVIIFAVAFTNLYLTRYMSLSSIIGVILFPICVAVFGNPIESVFLAVFIALLGIYQHRANIKRLLNGTEKRFSFKKSA